MDKKYLIVSADLIAYPSIYVEVVTKSVTKMRTTVTVMEARALAPNKTLTIHLEGRGAGSLLLKGGAKATTAFFRIRTGEVDSLLKLGRINKKEIRQSASPADSLAEIMKEARRLYDLAATVSNLKEHIDNENVEKQLALEARKSELEALAERKRIDSARGTFAELFSSYIDNVNCSEETKKEYRRALKRDILQDNPDLANSKARDIKSGDIIQILGNIYRRNSPGMADKMRSYLHAAFQFEIDRTHSYKISAGVDSRVFELESNPVSAIPKQFKSEDVTRVFSDRELARFYRSITLGNGVSRRMGLLFKLNIQIGGQRIAQLARARHCDFDFVNKKVYLIDRKGRRKNGAEKRDRVHIVPLTPAAIEIIDELFLLSEGFDYPFSENGKKPYLTSSFSHVTSRWIEYQNQLTGDEFPHFSPRDIRRTCSQLMKRLGVDQNESDALQSHGMSGVVIEHYLNNPELFTSDKISALKVYERGLKKILKDNPNKS
jgi:integrase